MPAAATVLLVVGAILKFAVTTTGSVYGVNLQIVGVILMLGGAAALLPPLLARTRSSADRPAARSRRDDEEGRPQVRQPGIYRSPADPDGHRRTNQGGE